MWLVRNMQRYAHHVDDNSLSVSRASNSINFFALDPYKTMRIVVGCDGSELE